MAEERRLDDPRARAALHVALELDAWPSADLATHLRASIGDIEAFATLVRLPNRAPLGVRVRLAGLLRAIANAARDEGLGVVLGDDRRDLYLETTRSLLADRNMFVALRAAAAAGTLLRDWGDAWTRLGLDGRDSATSRRRAAAFASAWLLGDVDLDVLENELSKGNADYAQGMAIHAMRIGWTFAPRTIEATVLTWLPRMAIPALASAATLAAAVEDVDARATITAAVRERAVALDATTHPLLRCWIDDGAETIRVLDAYRSLRAGARTSPASAAGTANELLERLGASDLGGVTDLVLFDSTVVRDVAVAGAPSVEAASEVRKHWLRTVGQVREHRVRDARDTHVHAVVRSERLRSLGFVLDALYDERSTGVAPAVLLDDIRKATASTTDVADRNAATAIAIVLEANALARDQADDLLVALTFPKRLLHHIGRAFSRKEVRGATLAAAHVRDVLDAIESDSTKNDDATHARALNDALTSFSDALRGLDVQHDHPLALAFGGAIAATQQMLVRYGSDALLVEVWARAIAAFEQATAGARERLEQIPLDDARPRAATAFEKRVEQAMKDGSTSFAAWPLDAMLRAGRRLRGALGPRPKPERWANTILGDYVVERELGAGGMGRCLLARRRSDSSSRRWVLKLPHGSVRGSRGKATRDTFRVEAQALLGLAAAEHPAIVPFIAYQERGYRSPFLVMGFVPGETLAKRVQAAPLEPPDAVKIVRALASALACAHAQAIAHNDIKPDNVIIDAKGDAILVDWGIAGADFRATGGTYGYMPPERFKVQHLPTSAAVTGDVFALGCVLYETLTGRALALPPLDADDALVAPALARSASHIQPGSEAEAFVIEAITNHDGLMPARARRALGATTPRIADLVIAMTRIDYKQRPTATAVVRALDELG